MGEYTFFIAASYGVTAVVLVAMVINTACAIKKTQGALSQLQKNTDNEA